MFVSPELCMVRTVLKERDRFGRLNSRACFLSFRSVSILTKTQNKLFLFDAGLTIGKRTTPSARFQVGPRKNIIGAPKADPLSPPGSSEQDNGPVNVDAILQSILGWGAERFGIAAAVLRGERIFAQGAAGVRKRGTAERITLDDRFHLGYCTKAMTATLVAMLVEEGKLNWTTTLGELFADTVKTMHPAWEEVTLRQVLEHRAGLP